MAGTGYLVPVTYYPLLGVPKMEIRSSRTLSASYLEKTIAVIEIVCTNQHLICMGTKKSMSYGARGMIKR